MAHTLRYYKEIEQPNYSVRLEIYAKNSEAPAVEIGGVMQQLSLEIQGQQEDIDAPIVKTSLTMTFVDAPDLEDGKKCGNWEEFYTPDSTMWKVVLKADGKTIWGGYITPDSYSEEISYRGPVTIIARDNIGHMQDFPFDMEGNAEGMVTLQQLVNEAWAKIESPMSLDWRHEADDAMYLICDGVEAPQTYMNVSAFEDMNYFDAVEKALYSYGLVMRYTGSNRVTIMSLRDLPYQGKSSAPRAIEPTFLAHAQRELAPAARRIEESVKYDIEESVALPRIKDNDFSGSSGTYRCAIEGVDLGYGKFGTLEHEAPIWPIIDTPHWSNIPSTSLAFNPKIYPIGYFSEQQGLTEDIYQPMYLAANNVDQRLIQFKHLINCAAFNLRIKFTDPISLNSSNKIERCSTFNLKSIKYAIFVEQSGVAYYYGKDGSWRIDYQELTEEYDATQSSFDFVKTINMGEFSGSTEITFAILKIEYAQTSSGLNKYGLYAGIQLLAFEQPEGNAVLETNNVNTKYVDSNNVIIERDPEFGPAYNTVTLPQIIKNGIFVKSGNAYLPAKGWAWSGGIPQQMAVYNHLQLLCYHSKPNNVISGDIAYADFVDMAAIYEWGGANHLLVSGSYNFLNGRIESAVLREFKFYTDMWSDVSGTSLPDTEQNNRTTAESGSGAAKASTYSNETTVNVGGSGGGGGTGGSSTLAGLLDVQVSSPSNGQALVYDSASGMWINKTIEKGDKVTSSTIIAALGYTPLNANLFTKANLGLGNVDNIAANKYFTALSSGTTNAVSMTIGGVTKNITAATLKTSLGLAGLAYQASVPDALGYTPFNAANFTKTNIKSTLGISDWALEADRPSYSKSDVGLDKVDNLAAGDYFTALSSDTTNAISATIGGVNKKITAATLKASLGLGSFAYLSEIPFSSITDVVVSNPSDGQFLSYDITRRRWVNKTFDLGEHISADIIVDTLGYEPFDSDAFTKSNIKNALGIADWALAANKPSYTWTEIGSRPTELSAFTNDLGLGSLAYKSSLVASDIPSLPWSKITSGKPTTLSGYGITDGLVYSDYINLDSAYRHIGYGYASIGWKTSGPAAVFGTASYNLRMQCAISTTDTPLLYISQMYNGEAKGWAELITYEGAKGRVFYASQYWIGDSAVLHRSGNDTYVNYGNRATGSLSLYGTSLYFILNGSSTPFKISADGKVHIAEVPLTKGTSNSLKAAAYEALLYFADGKLIMHRNEGAANLYFNYGGAAEPMYLYGSMYGFHIGASRERAFTIDSNKDASFAANLTVGGNLAVKGRLTVDLATSLKSTLEVNGNAYMYGRLGVTQTLTVGGESGCELYLARPSANYIWANQEGGYFALGVKDAGAIGGLNYASLGIFANELRPGNRNNAVALGSSSYQWSNVFSVLGTFSNSIKIGDATLTWDASAGMLKIDKGVYSEGAITAKKKA